MSNISERLSATMKQRGMTVKEVARALGKDKEQQVLAWLGGRKLHNRSVKKMAEVLRVEAWWLKTGRKKPRTMIERIQYGLIQSGMTLKELAERAGYSEGTVHSWLYCGAQPTVYAILDVAEALRIDWRWLIGG